MTDPQKQPIPPSVAPPTAAPVTAALTPTVITPPAAPVVVAAPVVTAPAPAAAPQVAARPVAAPAGVDTVATSVAAAGTVTLPPAKPAAVAPSTVTVAPASPAAKTAAPAAAPAAKKKAAAPASKAPGKSSTAAKVAAPTGPLTFLQSSQRRLRRASSFGLSAFLHVVVLLSLSLIVLPAKERTELFQTIISETIIPDQEINEKLDETTIVPDQVETTMPQLEVDSQIVSNTPSAFDLDVSDAAPQLEGPEIGGGGTGTGVNMPRGGGGELAGRSVKARGAMLASQGGTAASEVAVKGSLKWLARHQRPDGSWSFKHGPDDPGSLDNPNGATGLALLAFLGGGHTHKAGDYQKQVGGGLNFLLTSMKVTGAGGDLRMAGDGQGMYTQGICTIALCEAYALSKDKNLKQPTQLAVNFIVNAQDPKGGGWRYQPGQAGDTSVVGWQVMALKSAKIAKLQIPNKTIGKATFFLNSVQTEAGAKYGYDTAGAGPATSAVGLLCRMYLGWTPKNAGLAKGVEFLGATGPQPGNMYFNYYATQVLHHWGGEPWTKWNNVMREYLVKSQEKSGDAQGSWKPLGAEHGDAAGGRLYRTCLSVMTLEVYYRHLPLYQRETIKVDF